MFTPCQEKQINSTNGNRGDFRQGVDGEVFRRAEMYGHSLYESTIDSNNRIRGGGSISH